MASCQSKRKEYTLALQNIKRCLDEDTNYLRKEHKYFALAKIYYQLGKYEKAKHVLEQIVQLLSPKDEDYVFELMARILLIQRQPEEGLEFINKIPVRLRRPYVHWTEADLLLSLGRFEQAYRVLLNSIQRDRRSKHKSLIRLCKMSFQEKDYNKCFEYAKQTDEFHQTNYSTPDANGMFWQAASLLMMGKEDEAMKIADELKIFFPEFPYLNKLKERINESVQKKAYLKGTDNESKI